PRSLAGDNRRLVGRKGDTVGSGPRSLLSLRGRAGSPAARVRGPDRAVAPAAGTTRAAGAKELTRHAARHRRDPPWPPPRVGPRRAVADIGPRSQRHVACRRRFSPGRWPPKLARIRRSVFAP